MKDEYICKQDAAGVIEKEMENYVSDIWYKSATHSALNDVNENIKSLEPADVLPYSISNDGTLTVTVPKGIKKIGRILIEEDGTRYGGLFYPDTGGCFLSSMEKEQEHTD